MRIAAAVVYLALCSCARAADVRDRYDTRNARPNPTYMLSAEVVIVATVLSDLPDGPPQPATLYPDVSLQRRRVRCVAENVLKGEVDLGSLEFYYFTLAREQVNLSARQHVVLAPGYEAKRGKRYAFFLVRESGVLRSVGDVFNYSVPVLAGAHVDGGLSAEVPLGRALARILLTPGTGYNEHCFTDGPLIALSQYYLSTKAETINLLESSLTHADVRVRACACRQLVKHFPDRSGCLAVLLNDPQVDPDTKREIRDEVVRLSRRTSSR